MMATQFFCVCIYENTLHALTMSADNPSTTVIEIEDVRNNFCGWHYSAATIGNTTVGAIAANKMAETIASQLKAQHCFRAPGTHEASATEGPLDNASGTENYIGALQTDAKVKTRPLLQTPTLMVVGSAYNATPTLCYVEQWLSPTPLFTVVKSKALIHLKLMYNDWQQEKMVCVDDNIASATSTATHIAYRLNAVGEGITDIVLTQMQHSPWFDVAIASLYLATLVHHVVVTDGGTQFRDKQGRTAAAHQVALSCQNILFLINASLLTIPAANATLRHAVAARPAT